MILFKTNLDQDNLSFCRGQARELASPGLRAELVTITSNISNLEEAIKNFSVILGTMVKRSVEEANDMAGMSRELASLSNNTVFSLLDDEAEPNTPEIPDQIRDLH